jgi:hypothetical protein
MIDPIRVNPGLFSSIGLLVIALAPATVSAQEAPDEPRLDHEIRWPTLRVGLGYGRHFEGADRNAFELDVTAGLRSMYRTRGRPGQVGFLAEAGYTRHGATPGGHHAIVGAALRFGIGVGGPSFGPGIYGVAGRSEGERALGVRTVFAGDFLFTAFGFELSHEWRRIGDLDDHMVRVAFVVRIDGLVLLIALARADWDFH